MTRTETDLATAIAAAADVVVDTDLFVSTVTRRFRRRRRVRLAVAGAGTAVAALAVAVPVSLIATTSTATAPTPGTTPWAPRVFTGNCTVEPIPAPPGVEPGLPIWLRAVDPTGRYIIGSYGPPIEANGWTNVGGLPVLWDNGVGRVLPVAGENIYDVWISDVNRHGSVVGSLRSVVNNRTISFAWIAADGSQWRILPTPAGYTEAVAAAINDRGQVVGAAGEGADWVPVVWSPGTAGRWTSQVIDVSDGINGSAVGITGDGLVVGTLTSAPRVWNPDGTGRALPLPEGMTSGTVQRVRGDWAVGLSPSHGAEVAHLVRWNVRTGEMSVTGSDVVRAGPSSEAAVNARGDVAWVDTRNRPHLRTHDGQEYELPQPSDEREHSFLGFDPVGMSDDATLIAGYGGVLWRC